MMMMMMRPTSQDEAIQQRGWAWSDDNEDDEDHSEDDDNGDHGDDDDDDDADLAGRSPLARLPRWPGRDEGQEEGKELRRRPN